MPRKVEFTVRVCIRISPNVRRDTLSRWAERLEQRVVGKLPAAQVVHCQSHFRTWHDDA